METVSEKPKTRYNLPVLAHVRKLIAVETNHQQHIWTFVDRDALKKIVDRFTPKDSARTYVSVSCPTAACVAGWTAIVTGGRMLVPVEELSRSGGVDSANMVDANGVVQDIGNYARATLGLTYEEAEYLFASTHSNKAVLRMLDGIVAAGEAGKDWNY